MEPDEISNFVARIYYSLGGKNKGTLCFLGAIFFCLAPSVLVATDEQNPAEEEDQVLSLAGSSSTLAAAGVGPSKQQADIQPALVP